MPKFKKNPGVMKPSGFKMKKTPYKHKSANKKEYDENHPGTPNKYGHGPKGHHQKLVAVKPAKLKKK